MEDTIAALATAPGRGSIAVIRISGEKARDVLEKVFHPKNPWEPRKLLYGFVRDGDTVVDEAMAVYLPAPHTYTREDVAEIQCHGGPVPVERTLKLLFEAGARPAEPGEFTKRAFLNGRVDLTQAEAVMDLIGAEGEAAARVSLDLMEGKLSRKVGEFQSVLTDLLAETEAALDYPEEDLEAMMKPALKNRMVVLREGLQELLNNADIGRIALEGFRVVLAGRPNVGKSSLLNALSGTERAIVTAIAGTTRDTVEENIDIHGLTFHLLDTAGIRETRDTVESIGVARSRKAMAEAHLVLVILDGSEGLKAEDKVVLASLEKGKGLVVVNKGDLPDQMEDGELQKVAPDIPIWHVSAKTGEGLERLKDALYHWALPRPLGSVGLTHERHVLAVKAALASLMRADAALDEDMPADLLAMDLHECWEHLGEITGQVYNESIIDRIFEKFCLGK